MNAKSKSKITLNSQKLNPTITTAKNYSKNQTPQTTETTTKQLHRSASLHPKKQTTKYQQNRPKKAYKQTRTNQKPL